MVTSSTKKSSPEIIEQLKWRAAVKRFDTSKKLTENQLDKLLLAMNLAPSSYGLQPYRFYVVSSAEDKKILSEAGYGQTQLSEASHLVLFASSTTFSTADVDAYIQNIAQIRKVPVEDLAGFSQSMKDFVENNSAEQLAFWAARQVYIPLGVLLATASTMGIDNSPMEGFKGSEIDAKLGIAADGYTTRAIVALGYRSKEDRYSKMAKVRKSLSDVVVVR